MNIEEDPTFIEYISNQHVKENTKYAYKFRLQGYCNYTKLTPTQLIEEAENEEEERIRMKNRKIKQRINGFIKYIIDEKKSPNYVNTSITTIKAFYNEFEIELPKIRCKFHDEKELLTTETIITKKHIKKVLKYANIKYKAIILLMMSSGMGSSEIRELKIQDLITAFKLPENDLLDIDELLQKRSEIGTWSIRRYKTGMPYITFNSPESTNAIIDYLEDKSEKYEIRKENYLFDHHGKKMKTRGFTTYFARLNDTCGFGYLGRQRFFRSHGLRKYFASTLKNNGMDAVDAEWLLGHELPKVTNAYIKPDIYRLKKDYMDILPELCLEDMKTVTLESEDVKNLNSHLKKN